MRRMKKPMTAILLSFIIIILDISGVIHCFSYEAKAATFGEINSPEVFLKQVNGDKQCTLVAATMLLRRTAIMSGNTAWADITTDKVMEQAWLSGVGLKHSFTYAGITINWAAFGADPAGEALLLLGMHPEGIVIYDQIRSPRSHAVLLTDYTNGIFYGADPSGTSVGRVPEALMSVRAAEGEYYWYVSAPVIAPAVSSGADEWNNGVYNGVNSEVNNIAGNGLNNGVNSITDNGLNNGASNAVDNGANNTAFPAVIDINNCTAALSQTSFSYDGAEKQPAVSISGLLENKDYTVTYWNNVNPGSALVLITGLGTYYGTMIKNFDIAEVSAMDILNEIKGVLSKQTIKKGKTTNMKITLPVSLESVKEYSNDPAKTYSEVKISYLSANKKVASVNASGKVTGKKKGTTRIYAIAEMIDGTIRVFEYKIKVK